MRKIKNIIFIFIKWILTIMLSVLSIVVFSQIISRYIFKLPLVWSEELAILMMVWITFLGSVLVLDKLDHISIDFIVDRLSERVQSYIFIAGYILVLILNITFIVGGWEVIQTTKNSVMPGLNISVGWLYGGIFIGGILASLVTIEHLYHKFIFIYSNRRVGETND